MKGLGFGIRVYVTGSGGVVQGRENVVEGLVSGFVFMPKGVCGLWFGVWGPGFGVCG